MLNGKNVILGISGSIAVYKAAFLCRELIKKGANVKVLMTPNSAQFVTPLTFSTLSKNPVFIEYSNPETGEWNNHVELAKWADFFLLAPATQNTIAKMANGVCDNLLLATYFSMENKVYFAPAMDLDMHKHAANQKNIERLQSFGNILIPSEEGELASGLFGEGRMAEPENIITFLEDNARPFWKSKKVLVTAGPTQEAIDPVRYIGNRSSGKMGYAIAEELNNLGAEVYLISGPTSLEQPNVHQFDLVESAEEMFNKVKEVSPLMDGVIMSAAVADYKSESVSDQKIKKKSNVEQINLVPTEDILAHLGENKKENQFLVGFALETNNEIDNAKNKLQRKNLDLIVLNSLQNKGAGFGHDTNQVTILDKNNNTYDFELKSKRMVAKDILQTIEKIWH